MRRRLLTPAVLAAALALAAAGCGGNDSASAAEEWADGFCTSITTWSSALADVGDTFRDTSGLSVGAIRTALDDITAATKQFAREVERLGPPETESGAQVQSELVTLADDLGQSVQELQGILDAEATSLNEALQNVSQVTGILADMSAAIGTTFQEIEKLDSSGELADALESTASCNTLTTGS